MNIFSKIAAKTMMKNRTRTMVTIIGIILSAAMFTAVTTTVSSYLNYYRGYIDYHYGSWGAAFYGVTGEQLKELESDPQVGRINALQQLGFAEIGSENKDKPYLCVAAVEKDACELLPIRLSAGRMPDDDGEILLPDHLKSNGGVSHKLGDVLQLSVGTRVSGEEVLDNHIGYLSGEEGSDSETLENTEEHTYTVVGFYSRPSFEDFSAPGYTAVTVSEKKGQEQAAYDVFFNMADKSEVLSYYAKHEDDYRSGSVNRSYLRAYGIFGESGDYAFIYGLAAFLIGIILFGSVALIYNAFSISVSERTRMFGILSSVGATRRQLVRCVMTEGAFLGCVGIPMGILAGIAGMWITFQVIGDRLTEMLYESYPQKFTLHVSLAAILIAVLIAFVTIFLSAYIPVRKALKHTAIETIRQGDEIKLKGRQVKTFRLTQRLFGFEGMLAAKNFKRNRKKYRATVVSLFVSVVLFITASSFCAYLEKTVGTAYENNDYDLVAGAVLDSGDMADTLKKNLMMQKGTVHTVYSAATNSSNLLVDKQEVSRECEAAIENFEGAENAPDQILVDANLLFIDDEGFKSYADTLGIDAAPYINSKKPRALVYDEMKYYSDDGRYHLAQVYSDRKASGFTFALAPAKENLEYYDVSFSDGIYQWGYWDGDKDLYIPAAQNCEQMEISGELVSELPHYAYHTGAYYGVYFIFPYSQINLVNGKIGSGYDNTDMDLQVLHFAITSDDHAATAKEVRSYLGSLDGVKQSYVTDYTANIQEERSLVFIIDVFSYGFIILISLIAVANVFNTISTNIQLRGREFAMLRSVGMTPRGMRRMMNYECLLYGFKGLLYGIPVSLLLTYRIYRVVLQEIQMRFFIPWYSIMIAVGSVFLVVFATMVYAVRRLQKENTIDALKNENI